AGVGMLACAVWPISQFTSVSGTGGFVWPLVWRGAGLGLVFVPLTDLALAGLPMDRIPNGTGLFNLMRQLGGSLGIAASATLLDRFQTLNHARLAEHVTRFSDVARERLAGLTTTLIARGVPPGLADTRAIAMLDGQLRRQALIVSFERLFILFGWG